jgi:hypothetical protein
VIRKSLVLGLVILCAAVALGAQQSQKLTGFIIDNACAKKHSGDATAIEGHPVSCALLPACIKSGYALYSDAKLYWLDPSGRKKVEALLRNAPKGQKGFKVEVEGTVEEIHRSGLDDFVLIRVKSVRPAP